MSWYPSELVTRGTEIDTTATVGLPVFLRYFEQLRWRFMSHPDLGLEALIHDGHFFVVRSQTVEVRQRVGQEVRLALRTRLERVGRSTAEVIHEAHDEAGGLVARARVQGVWLGPDRRMARLPDPLRQIVTHGAPGDDAGPAADRPAAIASIAGARHRSFIDPPRVVFEPLSIAVDAPNVDPERVLFTHDVVVPPRDLDVFSHVNAATWLAYADDARAFAADAGAIEPAVARGYNVRTALFYAREASVHERLRVVLAALDDRPVYESRAVGAWVFRVAPGHPRDDEPRWSRADALCVMRLDLAPGARPITEPDRAA